ncbi:acyl-CoA dehydrogenase family protein [Mycolicibacterium thermoresistibile]
MTAFTLSAVAPDPSWRDLRSHVRGFIADELAAQRFTPVIDGWLTGWSETFSRALAGQGWIGMTIPRQYGGQGRSHFERFVVTEELLVAGAPVAAHWIADRQVAPSLMRYGTEEQKNELLPAIAAGRCTFAIGMSEPDSGSDLASVRTRAVPVDGGWRLNGTKVWTSGAHHANKILVLARTSGSHADRHRGLSQLIVDLRAPGVNIVPIESLDGGHHFNEVVFTDCRVPAADLLGVEGEGWQQVTAELGYERSGPERFLSVALLVRLLIEHAASGAVSADPVLGQFVARLHGLHQMSLSVAAALERGENADAAAAMVKMLGTSTEGDLVQAADYIIGSMGGPLRDAVARATLQRPGFTLRGGTNEVLAGVVARGLGLR